MLKNLPSAPLGWRQLRHLPLRLAGGGGGHRLRRPAHHDAARVPLGAVRKHAALPRALPLRHRAVQPRQRVHRAPGAVLHPPAVPGAGPRRGRSRSVPSTSSRQPGRTPGTTSAAASTPSASIRKTTSSTPPASPRAGRCWPARTWCCSTPPRGRNSAPSASASPPTARSSPRSTTGQIKVVGLFEVGPSFGIDATIITSDDNWLRLFPDRSRDDIELGLVRLGPAPTRPPCATGCGTTCRRTCW